MKRARIVPTVTAFDEAEYRRQMDVASSIADRVHIDLMDGEFAPSRSIALEHAWWPHGIKADIHLMYQRPLDHLDKLVQLNPNMVVIHNEVEVHHMLFAAELHKHDIKTGLAILQDTPIEWAEQIMHSFDQVLIFSGNLGYHGGEADLALLDKVKFLKIHHPDVEIAWDGGINDQNAKILTEHGVKVLNVGGYIQKSATPQEAYGKLINVIEG